MHTGSSWPDHLTAAAAAFSIRTERLPPDVQGTSDWLDPADWQLVVQFEGGFAQNWKPEYIRVSGGSREGAGGR